MDVPIGQQSKQLATSEANSSSHQISSGQLRRGGSHCLVTLAFARGIQLQPQK